MSFENEWEPVILRKAQPAKAQVNHAPGNKKFQKLDSEDPDKFVDFEALQRVKGGRLTKEEGLAIMGEGESLEKDLSIPKGIEQQFENLLPQILKKTTKDSGE